MNKQHPQDRRRVARRKKCSDPRWGSLPLPGQLSFDFWYEGVDVRKPVSSAEGCDSCPQNQSDEKKTA
jgi:hypothetical protein